MLVVIAVIALLASLIFPVTKAINKNKILNTAKVEMRQIESRIESYKAKLGYYPPDNPGLPATNQLYFELIGTYLTNATPGGIPFAGGVYVTLDGSAYIPPGKSGPFQAAFGQNTTVSGFMNCTRGTGGDEAATAVNFCKDISAAQFATLAFPSFNVLAGYFGAPMAGPIMMVDSSGKKLNPWRYNSSSPTNNPNSYDLWIDVLIDNKTNRICNWSTHPLVNPP
jgi:type II secretory pathway pseudopilin PulG